MRDQIYEMLKKWLWIEDEEGIDCILACAIAAMLPGDPLWMFIVDPPGAMKTEICRAFTGTLIYSLDILTPQSLLSGFANKKGKNVDILADLDGKLLVIKDFTAILQRCDRDRNELFGRLRAAYDGNFEGAFGSGVGKQARKATFGILAAVTPVIDDYTVVHTLLGERFVKIRTRYNRELATRKALRGLGHEVEMRANIAEIIRVALDFYRLKVQTNNIPGFDNATSRQLTALSDVTSILRTGIPRNYKNEVTGQTEPEVGTRLVKQFAKLSQALQVLDCYTYQHVVRVAKDTIPIIRMKILNALAESEKTTGELMKSLNLPRYVVLSTTEDLHLLKATERTLTDGDNEERKVYSNEIRAEFRGKLETAEILKVTGG